MGVRISASSELMRYCGVCTPMLYVTPLAQFSHSLGATCALDASEMSRLLLTSRAVSPSWPALLRSTFTRISG